MRYQDVSTRISGNSCGIYLAYPTTLEFKPVYRGYRTLVSSGDTKVGIALRSFAARERQYITTFHSEVVFLPILELPAQELRQFEKQLLDLAKLKYPRSGSAREWFRTTDRQGLAEIVWSLHADA